MEWALMVGSFYLMVLFAYGLTSELYKYTNTNKFLQALNSLGFTIANPMLQSIGKTIGKYLIALPAILNIVTIKLVTNYEGNREIRKSKKRTKQLNAVKWLFLINVFLYVLIVFMGFPIQMINDALNDVIKDTTVVPLIAIPVLYIFSIANLVMSIYLYNTY